MQILTRKDYDFYECSSAMQKCIRRGEEKKALFFALELYNSGYSKYVWKRILIITCEDIGLANKDLPTTIMSLFNMWELIAQKNLEEASMTLIQAILTLCRSEKSRIIDEYKIYLYKTDYCPSIPDYALDVHTRKGKMKGRDHNFFLEEGSKINNEVNTETPEEIKNFYSRYFDDYSNKRCDITGYDNRNVTHKNPKELAQWKKENNQTTMF